MNLVRTGFHLPGLCFLYATYGLEMLILADVRPPAGHENVMSMRANAYDQQGLSVTS